MMRRPQIQQMRDQAQEHRKRLPIIAINFARSYYLDFPVASKDLKLLYSYIHENHDIVKLMSIQELAAYGYTGDLDILTRLNEFFGDNRLNLAQHRRQELESLMSIFNGIEEVKKTQFFDSRGISLESTLVTEFRLIEEIVDATDTGIFRKFEFGLSQESNFNGAKYLETMGFAKKWVELSRLLEIDYLSLLGRPELTF